MASLANRRVQDTYTQLLRLREGITPEDPLTEVEDGAGNIYNLGGGSAGGSHSEDIGDNNSNTFLVNHNLDTRDVIVGVYRNVLPYDEVTVGVDRTKADVVTLDFGSLTPAVNEFRVIVAGGATTGETSSSPLTTKGDLYTFATTNTRLPVGNDGTVLVADSNEPSGVKWGEAQGGGGREVLTGPRTYYLDSVGGDDNNDGLTDTTPKQNLYHVFDILQKDIDCAGYKITINLTPGTTYEGFEGQILHVPTLVAPDKDTFDLGPGGPAAFPNSQLIIKSTFDGKELATIKNLDLDHNLYISLQDLNLVVDSSQILSLPGDFSAALRVSRGGVAELFNIRISQDGNTNGVPPMGLLTKEKGQIIFRGDIFFTNGDFESLLKASSGSLMYGTANEEVKNVISVGSGISKKGLVDISNDSLIDLFNMSADGGFNVTDGNNYVQNSGFITPYNNDQSDYTINVNYDTDAELGPESGYNYGHCNQQPVTDLYVKIVEGAPTTSVSKPGALRLDDAYGGELFIKRSSGWEKAALTKNVEYLNRTNNIFISSENDNNRRFFIQATQDINIIVDDSGATNQTFFEFINLDPLGTTLSIKINSNTSTTVATVDSDTSFVKGAYTGTQFIFWPQTTAI